MTTDLLAARPKTWREFRAGRKEFRQRMAAIDAQLASITADLAKLATTPPDNQVIEEVRLALAKVEANLREQR